MKRAGYLATDGSSQDDVAGFAVVLAAVDGFKAFGFSDCNEDQTSYRAESAALRTVAHAARLLASKKVHGTLYVLCDCQAALQALENPSSSALPLLAEDTCRDLAAAQRLGLTVHLKWTPAHGRQQSWKPDFQLDVCLCRKLNEVADATAKAVMQQRHAGSERAEWYRRLQAARAWSEGAIRLSVQTSEKLHCDNQRLARVKLIFDDEEEDDNPVALM